MQINLWQRSEKLRKISGLFGNLERCLTGCKNGGRSTDRFGIMRVGYLEVVPARYD